jgi:hypothetical protein
MFHLTCECGREIVVPKVGDGKTQVVICNCWRKLEIQWPGESETKKS